VGILYRLTITLILALFLISVGVAPAAALSVDDYFTYSYQATFSKDVVYGDEVFWAEGTARVTCTKDLPLSVSEAYVTGRMVARHSESGTEVILNSSYTVSIIPFPNKEGEVTQVSHSVPLQFPDGSEPGLYNVVGELIEARIKAILWFTVTDSLPPIQEIGPVTYTLAGDGGPIVEPPPAGTTSIAGKIDWRGVIIESLVAPSEDGRCSLTLNQGMKALDENGLPLQEIRIVEATDPPPPAENRSIIGPAYNIGPGGASFEPPATLAITYDELQIPQGASEEALVIAVFSGGQWLELSGSVVDPVANTVTAPVGHLSTFAVIAHTAPPAFTLSELTVSPVEAEAGEEVTISVLVVNSGDLTGGYVVTLRIDNEVVATREITLAGGGSELVSFGILRDAGTYQFEINGVTGSFVVREAALPELGPGPTVAPAQTLPERSVNWWLIGGIYVADVVLLVVVLQLIRRRWR
jgi:hypothetical protein